MIVTDTCVLDASAAIQALTDGSDVARRLLRRLSDADVHAPHLLDAEVGNVLRRQVLAGRLSAEVAATALATLPGLVGQRYPHGGWLTRHAWRLRDTVPFYDGLYAALAARLDVPLVTADLKLAGAPGLPCAVDVV